MFSSYFSKTNRLVAADVIIEACVPSHLATNLL